MWFARTVVRRWSVCLARRSQLLLLAGLPRSCHEPHEPHCCGSEVAAKYILTVLAAVFLAMTLLRGGPSHPQSRTWLIIGVIFGVVSAWLFSQG